jgi:hypothetical protein
MCAASTLRPRRTSAAAVFVLPVSGTAVALRQPTGAEDVLLAEYRVEDPALALVLAERLGQADPVVDWAALPVHDIDTLIVRLRQAVVGNRVIAEIACTSPSCGQRVDMSFGIDAYLAHQRPRHGQVHRRYWRAERSTDAADWYVLYARDADDVRFRLPTLTDQIAVYEQPDAAAALAARCISPSGLPARERARAEAAMAMLAPPVAGPLQGRCPFCTTPIVARFEARLYCLQELRDRASFVYDDIDALAERYHWSERAILTLPHARRANYVERVRQARLA